MLVLKTYPFLLHMDKYKTTVQKQTQNNNSKVE